MADKKPTKATMSKMSKVSVKAGDRIMYGEIPGVVSAVEGRDVYLFLFGKDGASLVRNADPSSYVKI